MVPAVSPRTRTFALMLARLFRSATLGCRPPPPLIFFRAFIFLFPSYRSQVCAFVRKGEVQLFQPKPVSTSSLSALVLDSMELPYFSTPWVTGTAPSATVVWCSCRRHCSRDHLRLHSLASALNDPLAVKLQLYTPPILLLRGAPDEWLTRPGSSPAGGQPGRCFTPPEGEERWRDLCINGSGDGSTSL